MFKNNNRKIIKRMAKNKMKSNKGRYGLLLVAIIMTTVLLTGTLTVGASFMESNEYTKMRQVGSTAHGGYKYLTPKMYKQIASHPDIKQKSYMQTIGIAKSKAFKTRSQQIFYMDEQAIKFSFILPLIDGEIPKADDEILVNTLTLDMLGLPHKVGIKMKVDIDMDGEVKPVNVTVAGIYEGDHVAMADLWIVSKPLADKLLKGLDIAYDAKNMKYTGLIQMGVMLDNPKHTYEKLFHIAKEQGITGINDQISVNWAYTENSDIQKTDMITYAMLLLLLMFSGYLVIYNIFYIGIIQDVQFYGMLKTIGCTKKQIKRIVMWQGMYLAGRGIPIGLIIGYGVGKVMSIYTITSLGIKEAMYAVHPLIFIFGSILTVLTVYISAKKPAKMATKISPIEATKIAEIKSSKKHKKKRAFHIVRMAKDNVMRYKKKAIIVILSMTISLVLLQTVTTSTNAVDMDKMVNHMIAGDYTIGSMKFFDYDYNYHYDAVNEEIVKTLENIDGVSLYKVYGINKSIIPSEELVKRAQINEATTMLSEINLIKGKQEIDIYGIDEGNYNYVKEFIIEGEIDKEKFTTGKGIVISKTIPHFSEEGVKNYEDIYEIGDVIEITDEAGKMYSYEVLAFVGDMPYYLYDGNYTSFGMNVYMHETACKRHNEKMPIMLMSAKVEKERKKEVADRLQQIVKTFPEIGYKSRNDYIEDLSQFDNLMKVLGYGLSGFLGLIAILNFVNTFVSSILARRQELAMLQSIGMTSKQLLTMLIIESGFLSAVSIVASFFIGGLISRELAKNVMFSTGQISFAPLYVVSPILIFFLSFVPIITYNRMRKESLVERLRVVE